MPKVSIIVPFWGVEKYIAECIESIISQTFRDFELLLIDDCSQDRSREIAESFARKDSRIKIIVHVENLGLGGARNTGLKNAQGEFIWYIDSDDKMYSDNALEKIYSCAKKYNSEVVIFDFKKSIKNQTIYCSSAKEQFIGYLDSRASVERFVISNFEDIHFVWNKFFKKEFLISNQCFFLQKTEFEDTIHLLWLFNSSNIFYLPQPYYFYRIRENSIMRSKKDAQSFKHLCRMAKAYDEYYFANMNSSRNARVLVLAKRLYFLLLAGASARCYIDSSLKEKTLITNMIYESLSASKLYQSMNKHEVNDTFHLFEDKDDFLKLDDAIRRNAKEEAKGIIYKILRNKHGITFKKISNKLKAFARPTKKNVTTRAIG